MALLYLKNKIFGRVESNFASKYSALGNVENDPENGASPSESGTELGAVEKDDEDVTEEHTTSVLKEYFHSSSSRFFFNLTLGLSDGMVVPFALTSGLTRFGDTSVVIFGGLAEVVAGCISMGLGGFMSSKGEIDAYRSELKVIRRLMRESPEKINQIVQETFARYQLPNEILVGMTDHFKASPEQGIDFILRFNRSVAVDSTSRLTSVLAGLTISLGYFIGGMLPLLPYFMHSTLDIAFAWSVAIMIVVLFAFGFTRSWYLEGKLWKRSIRAGALFLFTGGTAVIAAMTCTKLIPRDE